MLHDQLTVQIMMGGLSSRMGTDKALVTLGGKTLLDRAISRWQGYGAALQLAVGAAERKVLAPAGIPAVADVYPERGPLSGLHAGLRASPTELLLLVAVDNPYLTQAHADRLLEAIGDADACIYVVNGQKKPLFGLYRRRCANVAETMILRGDCQMTNLPDWVNTVTVAADDPAPFHSLDTPDEVAEAEDQIGSLT